MPAPVVIKKQSIPPTLATQPAEKPPKPVAAVKAAPPAYSRKSLAKMVEKNYLGGLLGKLIKISYGTGSYVRENQRVILEWISEYNLGIRSPDSQQIRLVSKAHVIEMGPDSEPSNLQLPAAFRKAAMAAEPSALERGDVLGC